jgi:hypothetical protein
MEQSRQLVRVAVARGESDQFAVLPRARRAALGRDDHGEQMV